MPKAGEINIFLNALTSGFDAGLSKAQKSLSTFTKGFADINGAVRVVVDSLSLASGVAAYFGDQLERLDDLADMSQRLSISATSIQEFQRALQLTGGEVEGLSASLAILQRNIGKAAMGEKGPAEAIKQLGLDAQVLANAGLDESFRKIVSEISKMPTPAERAAAASELFGKSASNLTGLLSDQGKALRDAGRDIRQYGIEVDTNAKAIDAAVKASERAELAKGKASSALSIASAPYLENFYGGAEFLFASLAEIEFSKITSNPGAFIKSYLFSAVNAERRHQMSRFDPSRLPSALPATNQWSNVNYEVLDESLKRMERMEAGRENQPPDYDYLNFDEVYNQFRPYAGPAAIGGGRGPQSYAALRQAIGVDAFSPGGRGMAGGTAALEFGTASAFSAIQQSRRQDDMQRLQKQEVEESKKQTKLLEDILDAGTLLMSLDLQG